MKSILKILLSFILLVFFTNISNAIWNFPVAHNTEAAKITSPEIVRKAIDIRYPQLKNKYCADYRVSSKSNVALVVWCSNQYDLTQEDIQKVNEKIEKKEEKIEKVFWKYLFTTITNSEKSFEQSKEYCSKVSSRLVTKEEIEKILKDNLIKNNFKTLREKLWLSNSWLYVWETYYTDRSLYWLSNKSYRLEFKWSWWKIYTYDSYIANKKFKVLCIREIGLYEKLEILSWWIELLNNKYDVKHWDTLKIKTNVILKRYNEESPTEVNIILYNKEWKKIDSTKEKEITINYNSINIYWDLDYFKTHSPNWEKYKIVTEIKISQNWKEYKKTFSNSFIIWKKINLNKNIDFSAWTIWYEWNKLKISLTLRNWTWMSYPTNWTVLFIPAKDIKKWHKFNFNCSYKKDWWDYQFHSIIWESFVFNKILKAKQKDTFNFYPNWDFKKYFTKEYLKDKKYNILCNIDNNSQHHDLEIITIEEPVTDMICWNWEIEEVEECDDWNTISWDRCSSTCKVEKSNKKTKNIKFWNLEFLSVDDIEKTFSDTKKYCKERNARIPTKAEIQKFLNDSSINLNFAKLREKLWLSNVGYFNFDNKFYTDRSLYWLDNINDRFELIWNSWRLYLFKNTDNSNKKFKILCVKWKIEDVEYLKLSNSFKKKLDWKIEWLIEKINNKYSSVDTKIIKIEWLISKINTAIKIYPKYKNILEYINQKLEEELILYRTGLF